MRGWQLGAVGACVLGAVVLLGPATWARVVTPQPWPGVVGTPIVVTTGPAVEPTSAGAMVTALPSGPSGGDTATRTETGAAPAPQVVSPARVREVDDAEDSKPSSASTEADAPTSHASVEDDD